MNSPLNIKDYELLSGNALTVLKDLPDRCIQCCIVSPPYYALRKYGCAPQTWGGRQDCEHEWGDKLKGSARGGAGPRAKETSSGYGRDSSRGRWCRKCNAWRGELGLEPSPHLFVEHIVEICKEIRRVLRNDGTFFLNIGDTYSHKISKEFSLPDKNLYGIPWKLAFALRDDGWILRQDCIWSKAGGNCPKCHYRLEKGSCLPEPVKDRFVRSHEYVFLLTKSKNYYFDHISVKASHSSANRRDVIHLPSQSFRGAHYAVMPVELAEILLRGGTSDYGSCAKCRAPYKRVTKKGERNRKKQKESGGNIDGEYHGKNTKTYEDHNAQKASDVKRRVLEGMREVKTVGWKQTCKCESPGPPVPCIVMDAFSGAGTTGVAAIRNGRRYLGIELVESNNTEIAKPRIDAELLKRRPSTYISLLPKISGVYHGKAELLSPRLIPNSVKLILTDPPYNTSRKNNFHTMKRRGIDFDWDGEFDQEEWIRLVDPSLMPGGSIVVWNDWKLLGFVADVLKDMGYDVKRPCLWIKKNPFPRNIQRSAVQRAEFGLWAVKPGDKWTFNKRSNNPYEDLIFEYPVPRRKKGRPRHDSKKPDELFKDIIEIFSNPGDIVLDPFSGGGTTAFAAESLDRVHISFEESEEWYEESIRHWEDAEANRE